MSKISLKNILKKTFKKKNKNTKKNKVTKKKVTKIKKSPLKKIKKRPTIKAKIAKNNTSAGVFKLTARKVPAMTPNKMKIPKDLTILKSTASYSI